MTPRWGFDPDPPKPVCDSMTPIAFIASRIGFSISKVRVGKVASEDENN